MRIEISRILHKSFAITWTNSGSHDFRANTDYQLIYMERTLYNKRNKVTKYEILKILPYRWVPLKQDFLGA